MTQWKGQYAPWIEDPDEDQEPMLAQQLRKAAINPSGTRFPHSG